ncbi:MAG: hypothetical protein OXQ29_00705 [Rhodospirillaceae bacterium]|nr:hypothetical protein [Rhodospirillaceae bacterium]
MAMGLDRFREPSRLGLRRLLLMPFIDRAGGYAIAAPKAGPRSRADTAAGSGQMLYPTLTP